MYIDSQTDRQTDINYDERKCLLWDSSETEQVTGKNTFKCGCYKWNMHLGQLSVTFTFGKKLGKNILFTGLLKF